MVNALTQTLQTTISIIPDCIIIVMIFILTIIVLSVKEQTAKNNRDIFDLATKVYRLHPEDSELK